MKIYSKGNKIMRDYRDEIDGKCIVHDWYYGRFVKPVYGRIERHCLKCGRREYYNPFTDSYVPYGLWGEKVDFNSRIII